MKYGPHVASVVGCAATVALIVTLAWLGVRPAAPTEANILAEVPDAAPGFPPSMVLTSDPVKIFRKAFWRSPAANDHVLHAERREWTGEDGTGKWQWFLVVQPSPDLRKYLRDDNAFGLVKTKTATPLKDAPAWFAFKPAAVEVLQAPTANLQLVFSEADQLLYATDSGESLRPGAPEVPVVSKSSATSTGRLPLTSPPATPSGDGIRAITRE